MKDMFYDPYFLGKMETASLKAICILLINIVLDPERFCFERTIKTTLQNKWKNIVIR
jgi:hypothetical protein